MNAVRLSVLVGLIAFGAAIAGVWIGRTFIPTPERRGTQLHEALHHEIRLDEDQKAQIDTLERRFAVRRQALELELRSDNARLAEAIEAEHGMGPGVAGAVDASHHAMGELQKATLAHIFAMRAVLKPNQRGAFDRAVVRSLTADAR